MQRSCVIRESSPFASSSEDRTAKIWTHRSLSCLPPSYWMKKRDFVASPNSAIRSIPCCRTRRVAFVSRLSTRNKADKNLQGPSSTHDTFAFSSPRIQRALRRRAREAHARHAQLRPFRGLSIDRPTCVLRSLVDPRALSTCSTSNLTHASFPRVSYFPPLARLPPRELVCLPSMAFHGWEVSDGSAISHPDVQLHPRVRPGGLGPSCEQLHPSHPRLRLDVAHRELARRRGSDRRTFGVRFFAMELFRCVQDGWTWTWTNVQEAGGS